MVRNLMMIFGLTLAVAAFGCSDDDATNAGGAGGSGSGGSGGSDMGTAPACDNTDDLAAIASGQPENALSIACGTLAASDSTLCDPDASGMNDCYQDGTDTVDGTTLSTECSYCYSELTCCTFVKCSVLAMPPSDPPGNCAGPPLPGSDCQACIDRECQPAFDTCGEGAGGSGGNGGTGGDPTDPA